jgi:hypothetical protein
MPRYLTKSRFKLALDCPAKLFYTGKRQYPDTSENDAFLEALAEAVTRWVHWQNAITLTA